jgi:hypothetical protein
MLPASVKNAILGTRHRPDKNISGYRDMAFGHVSRKKGTRAFLKFVLLLLYQLAKGHVSRKKGTRAFLKYCYA